MQDATDLTELVSVNSIAGSTCSFINFTHVHFVPNLLTILPFFGASRAWHIH